MDLNGYPLAPLVKKMSSSTGLSYLLNSRGGGTIMELHLLIHGWSCTSLDYVPLVQVLAAANPRALYIVPDLAGHGESPTSLSPNPAVSGMAALLNKLCREVCAGQDDATPNVERVLSGHSMGCRIALEVFAQEPGNVRGIVLLDGSWHEPDPKDDKPRHARVSKMSQDEEQSLRRDLLDRVHVMFGPHTPENFKQQVAGRLAEIDLGYAMELGRDYTAWDAERMKEVLRMVRDNKWADSGETKVLVVQSKEGLGAKRRMLSKGEEGSWMRLVREEVGERVKTVVVEDSGHWPHIDKLQATARAIEDFLNNIRLGG